MGGGGAEAKTSCIKLPEGFHYDMNSQYPNDMKFNMPTGNPVFSNNTNLNYYNLGFVFARIKTPSKDILPNPFHSKTK